MLTLDLPTIGTEGYYYLAWFQIAATGTVEANTANSALSIQENSQGSISEKAEITVVLEDVTAENMLLSTWVDEDTNENDEVHSWYLHSGAHAAGAANNTAVLSRITTQTNGYITVKVSAYLKDTTSETEKAKDGDGHAAAWAAAINAMQSNFAADYTFAYNSSYSSDSTTALQSTETKFYYVADTSSADVTIDKTLEAAGNASFQVNAKTLLADSKTDSGHMAQLGFLVVRAEGSLNGHENGTSYVAPIKLTSSVTTPQ